VYYYFLIFHSYFRWVVVLALFFQLSWIFYHYNKQTIFLAKHHKTLTYFTLIYNIQFLLGWTLYLNSPIITAFWNDVSLGLKNRPLRFFGIEHMIMMTFAIGLINTYTHSVKRKIGSNGFSYLLKRYILIILIVFSSIPWSFSPFTNRPNWR